MPQKVIAKQMSLESASDPIAVVATVETVPSETVAVESYADRLMDELFEGVDRAFDGSEGLPAEQMPPAEFVALKSISVPQIVLSQLAPEPPRGGEQEVAAIARQVALETTKKQSKQSFDRILLGAACGSLLLVMGLWLASRSGLVRLPAAPTPQTPAASGKIAPDTQFVEYVQRSLVAIEQKKAPQANSQLATVPGAATPGTLPSISISGAPPATAGLSTAVNRIANALEQAAAAPGAPAPQVVVIPPPAQVTVAPAAPTQVNVAVPAASQTAAGSPSPSASASGRAIATAGNRSPLAAAASPSESVQPKILARETESAPAPAAGQSAPAPQQSAAAVTGAPASAQTLVGILELGDRSAALFEVDGVARRIYVGESIGASGWTLAEIKNQEAVIRKGGDVRSVFVGQKF
ncbi:MAG: hypothetical protein EAZ88_18810 [Oscillatoriales cyanobacterium]|jgi:hypothetical protein|nr:MAG: hypothetical protein EAZ88_18810 [Oscillatoriales cyanobacterium]